MLLVGLWWGVKKAMQNCFSLTHQGKFYLKKDIFDQDHLDSPTMNYGQYLSPNHLFFNWDSLTDPMAHLIGAFTLFTQGGGLF